jgi:hypothetical protein
MLSVVSETVTTMPDGPRYEDDFFAWTQHQAMVLRSMAVADNRFDRANVAEEIEDLGRSQRDTVRSQIRAPPEAFLFAGAAAALPLDGVDSRGARCSGRQALPGIATRRGDHARKTLS